jgi:hypothetical protein
MVAVDPHRPNEIRLVEPGIGARRPVKSAPRPIGCKSEVVNAMQT